MAKGAFNPDEAWSEDHWLNSMGMVILLYGPVEKSLLSTEGGLLKPKLPKEIDTLQETIDLKLWKEVPVSGQNKLTTDGLRIMSIRVRKTSFLPISKSIRSSESDGGRLVAICMLSRNKCNNYSR
ncbi:hypothetical protein [Paenibacillus sp.]|uniref:hypothetical protein n=1 Tax=Paenibacillus sp. TaxID=58172 RepID=UPI0028A70838|nr:hypothetical protein [Paenibacillus sp.]